MRVLLDTCVLYPTVMREMLLGVAREGVFEPLWSHRILEEWARAARKIGPTGEAQARAEIALAQAAFPDAAQPVAAGMEARLWLPDADDIHVLAAAVSSSADLLMTLNARDFPRHILREEGVDRVDPDGFLHAEWLRNPDVVARAGLYVLREARRLSEQDWTMRTLLKKARLPRCAKALSDVAP